MSRAFWFLLGVAITVVADVKARAYYRGLPTSVQQRVESSVGQAASRAEEVVATYRRARAEKESELTARLRSIERGQLP